MKTFFLLLYLVCMIPQSFKTIENFRWKKRVVLMNSDLLTIDSLLNGLAKEVEDRKLLFLEFSEHKLIRTSSEDKIDPEGFLKVLTNTASKSDWILVGLDGGVKASGNMKEFSITMIFQLIDQMPMRQLDIQRKKK